MSGEIHNEHPFVPPIEHRDPLRRFRGRLAAAVTVVTSGDDDRAGLTVSSLMVAEGSPGLAYALINPATDLYVAMLETQRFVIHICEARHRVIADVFAGLRPSPGGPFAGLEVESGTHGPLLLDIGDRMYCTLVDARHESHSVLVAGSVDRIDVIEEPTPLVYHRGGYRSLRP